MSDVFSEAVRMLFAYFIAIFVTSIVTAGGYSLLFAISDFGNFDEMLVAPSNPTVTTFLLTSISLFFFGMISVPLIHLSARWLFGFSALTFVLGWMVTAGIVIIPLTNILYFKNQDWFVSFLALVISIAGAAAAGFSYWFLTKDFLSTQRGWTD